MFYDRKSIPPLRHSAGAATTTTGAVVVQARPACSETNVSIQEPGPGWIYALQHPAWAKLQWPAGAPGTGAIKIGRTGRDPYKRAAEITASSGLVAPATIAFAIQVDDVAAIEQAIHRELRRYRIRRRELFRVDVDTARRVIESAACRQATVPRPLPAPRKRPIPRRRRSRRTPRAVRRLLWAGAIGAAAMAYLALVS